MIAHCNTDCKRLCCIVKQDRKRPRYVAKYARQKLFFKGPMDGSNTSFVAVQYFVTIQSHKRSIFIRISASNVTVS